MCVILIGRIGKNLHEVAKKQNPDGFSLFTAEQGLIKAPNATQVKKAVEEFGIWHYRIRSSGKVDKENIHPFPVAQGKAYLYHNGILGAGTPEYSDTNCLARTLYDCPISTVESVLNAVSSGQRLLLVDANDPRKFRLYGDWKVESGIIMSHKIYTGSAYSSMSKSQKAGWVTRDESCYPERFSLVDYRDNYGSAIRENDPDVVDDSGIDWSKIQTGGKNRR